jgi:hypothetical protein
MTDDAVWRDREAREKRAGETLDRGHLFFRERTVTPLVAGVDDLDPDRNLVEVAAARPTRSASMKRLQRLGNEPPDRPVLLDDKVSADPRLGITHSLDRLTSRLHAGVMQHQHVDPRRLGALGVVWREPIADPRQRHANRAPPFASR